MTRITRRRPCVAWHATTGCDPCLLLSQVCATPPREAYTRVYVYRCIITQFDVKLEARSNPQSWQCISRRTLANLNDRRLKFRRAIPIWFQQCSPAAKIHGGGPIHTELALTDARGVLGPHGALPAATGLKQQSASSGSLSPKAPGPGVLPLAAPMKEATHTTMAASQSKTAAPTAESTSTVSSHLGIRRLASSEEPPVPEPVSYTHLTLPTKRIV